MTINILISGATSAIAQAFAQRYASNGANFVLLGRSQDKLSDISADLQARGADKTEIICVDMAIQQDYEAIVNQAVEVMGHIDIALIAQGVMREQKDIENDHEYIRQSFQVNTLSAIEICASIANHFEQRSSGSMLVISSVAGDRGRKSNYLYGSTKAALSTYADGLRNRLAETGVNIITVKPGFVDTPMTSDYKKGALWAQPDKIAEDMQKAIDRGASTLYTPWFWRFIMLIIQHIPEFIFKRLSI